MDLKCEERASDSPLVERVWASRSESSAASFISMADFHCGVVVTRHTGRTSLTVRGPETRATPAHSPADAEFMGIQFKPGVFFANLPPGMIINRRDVNLPEAPRNAFFLNGSVWQLPDFENADTFVERLVRDGVLVNDPVVADVLQDRAVAISGRTIQRRFLQSVGITQATARQIARARRAAILLKQGIAIIDAVHAAGYYDQPHLTRSLKRFIGLTPAQIIDQNRPERLSFLYKTDLFYRDMIGASGLQIEENRHTGGEQIGFLGAG